MISLFIKSLNTVRVPNTSNKFFYAKNIEESEFYYLAVFGLFGFGHGSETAKRKNRNLFVECLQMVRSSVI